MSFSYLLSRSPLVAFAVVISCLVFIKFHAEDSHVPISSATHQGEFTAGADTMVAMQGGVHLKSGQRGKCSGNSKPAASSAESGNSDAIIAIQNRVHLELGDAEGNRRAAKTQEEKAAELVDEERVVLLESEKVLVDEAGSEVVDDDAADDAFLASHAALPFLTGVTPRLSGVQKEKVLSEEAESEVVANDADALPSSNAAVMKVWRVLTEDRSEVDDAADDALPSILKESKSDDAAPESGVQVKKEEVVSLESEKVPFEEAESEAVSNDADALPSSNGAVMKFWHVLAEDRSFDNAAVAAGLDTSTEEKGKVSDTVARSVEASSSAVSENKTSKATGTMESGQSNTLSLKASGQDLTMQELASRVHRTKSLSQTIRQMVAVNLQALSVAGNPGLAFMLMFFILMCSCLCGALAFKISWLGKSPSTTEGTSLGMDQRQAMMERWPPSLMDQPVPPTSGSILPSWPRRENSGSSGNHSGQNGLHSGHAAGNASKTSSKPSLPMSSKGGITLSNPTSEASVGAVAMSRPMSQMVMTQPMSMAAAQDAPSRVRMTPPWTISPAQQLSESELNRDPRSHLTPAQQLSHPLSLAAPEVEEVPANALPPPLCPLLVMNTCEARFGVPMFELAEVNGEGEVGIVGLSGAPLLRGIVRKIGNMRSLEIAMNEANSAPRATITPSVAELAGHEQLGGGARALEIRGTRGAFYGTLEMRACMDGGTCVVVKDGETIMRVIGNPESLNLQIQSGGGVLLASVCCSSQAFGGIDHIEIRVQTGVDAVLVLAVVLAILLLSPYMQPSKTNPSRKTSDEHAAPTAGPEYFLQMQGHAPVSGLTSFTMASMLRPGSR